MTSIADHAGSDSGRPAVGILVTDNRRRGAEVQAERTAEGLHALGWNVEFRSLASSPEPVVGAKPLTTKRRSELGRFDPSLVGPTRRFLRRHRGGVVLGWGSLSVRYVAAASVALPRRPRLGYVSIGSPSAWVTSNGSTARYRLVASRYDFIISVSERTKRELEDAFGIPGAKITVIHSGVPPELLNIPRSPHGGPIRVLFIGALSEEKDPLAAVNVFAVAADAADVRLRVVGDGPLREAAGDLAEALHVEERVELAGSVADVSPELEWADVLLLTSRTEGLPGVLIEAAAAGVPTVAYDVGAVTEIVDHERSGFVVQDRSVEVAAEALVKLAGDDELRTRLGNQARAIARERFLIASAVDRTNRLLRDQLG